jgi:zinc transporter, ZIP family
MYALKLVGERIDNRTKSAVGVSTTSYAFIATVFIDAGFDGLTIGAGYAAGQQVGFALAVGLSIEMLFLCLCLVSPSLHGTKMLLISVGVAATLLVTAVVGYFVLNRASDTTIAMALTISAAALLYLVTEELLMEAHETTEARSSMLFLFGGFLAFWIAIGV